MQATWLFHLVSTRDCEVAGFGMSWPERVENFENCMVVDEAKRKLENSEDIEKENPNKRKNTVNEVLKTEGREYIEVLTENGITNFKLKVTFQETKPNRAHIWTVKKNLVKLITQQDIIQETKYGYLLLFLHDENIAKQIIEINEIENIKIRIKVVEENYVDKFVIKGVDSELSINEVKENICNDNAQKTKLKILQIICLNKKFADKQGKTLLVKHISKERPKFIIIHRSRYSTETYKNWPVICTKCYDIGHFQKLCPEEKALCPRCGTLCNNINCKNPIKCKRCKGSHFSSDKRCQIYREACKQVAGKSWTTAEKKEAENIKEKTARNEKKEEKEINKESKKGKKIEENELNALSREIKQLSENIKKINNSLAEVLHENEILRKRLEKAEEEKDKIIQNERNQIKVQIDKLQEEKERKEKVQTKIHRNLKIKHQQALRKVATNEWVAYTMLWHLRGTDEEWERIKSNGDEDGIYIGLTWQVGKRIEELYNTYTIKCLLCNENHKRITEEELELHEQLNVTEQSNISICERLKRQAWNIKETVMED